MSISMKRSDWYEHTLYNRRVVNIACTKWDEQNLSKGVVHDHVVNAFTIITCLYNEYSHIYALVSSITDAYVPRSAKAGCAANNPNVQ